MICFAVHVRICFCFALSHAGAAYVVTVLVSQAPPHAQSSARFPGRAWLLKLDRLARLPGTSPAGDPPWTRRSKLGWRALFISASTSCIAKITRRAPIRRLQLPRCCQGFCYSPRKLDRQSLHFRRNVCCKAPMVLHLCLSDAGPSNSAWAEPDTTGELMFAQA